MTNARILIVEDEAMTAADLKHQLLSLGYQVVALANTAEEAVKAAEHLQPDLVFMDITLPGKLDGITAAVTIRGTTGAPVVFLTAHADDKTMDRALLAGPFGYLIKPFNRPELKAAIEVALRKHQAEREQRG